MSSREGSATRWRDAQLAATLFASDPLGQGLVLRAPSGPVRDRWLDELRTKLGPARPLRQLSPETPLGRLVGELDIAGTLQAGRPIIAQGLLSEVNGGVLIITRGESLDHCLTNVICNALDSGTIGLERDGLSSLVPTKFGLVVLDEGCTDDEIPPASLLDRCGLRLDLSELSHRDLSSDKQTSIAIGVTTVDQPDSASVTVTDAMIDTLCQSALAFGIISLRTPQQALRIAKSAAALDTRAQINDEDIALACRLVYAPQARCVPQAAPPAPEPPPTETEEHKSSGNDDQRSENERELTADELNEIILAATLAAIPAGLLEKIACSGNLKANVKSRGRVQTPKGHGQRGRPLSSQPGDPRSGRLDVIATLRAAAPWQSLRRQICTSETQPAAKRLRIHREDFRIKRYQRRSSVVTIFAVDASGSAALHRLAETKGAVELLLGECYVRRDRVALIAFRGKAAELLLPPTRSLVRAKRSLSALPGGGGTPLALGIEAAALLADDLRRHGETPTIVLMTDGRANVTRAGMGNREEARRESLDAAQLVRRTGITTLLIDTAPQPQQFVQELGQALNARYLALPHADAGAIAQATQSLLADRRAA